MSRWELLKLGLQLLVEGVKYARSEQQERERQIKLWEDIQRRHVERRDLSKDQRPR